MSDLFVTLGSIIAFMLVPVWIPIIAVVVGGLVDLVKPRPKSTVASRRIASAGSAP